MTINNRYKIGQEVYLISDEDQYLRIVTGIKIIPGGVLTYLISCGTLETEHYDIEITGEPINDNLTNKFKQSNI